jgi:hypothetical protein
VRKAADIWPQLTAFSDTYTCYSAALATWVAHEREDWPEVVNPGLWLTVGRRGPLLLGFSHFPPGLRTSLGLERTGSDDAAAASEGIREELLASGRVIVAGDGFNLPWHVAFGRRHVPHWYVLLDGPDGRLEMSDPFACRNELGVQDVARRPVPESELAGLLPALPGDDPVLALRESLALGDETEVPTRLGYQWFVRRSVSSERAPSGAAGPDAVALLAGHFRDHGQDPAAYAQADDIWSIARHRAFLCRQAAASAEARGDDAQLAWVREQAEPLARRWGHMAPLLMQATLALGAGRQASASVPEALDALEEMERSAALALASI